MKLATFNVENLFNRAKVMNADDWSVGKPVLDKMAELTKLFEKAVYTDDDKSRMITLMTDLGLRKDDTGRHVQLRRNRGTLITRPRSGPPRIKANGREDWVGWLELIEAPVNEISMLNTAQVMRDLKPDILAVQETEDRTSLKAFSDNVLREVDGTPFNHVFVIDGNDRRGIDVGLLTGKGYDVSYMRSHVHDTNSLGQAIFSRDCPEYMVTSESGEVFWVLVNHFKSKGYGSQADNDNRRHAQADAVATHYRRLVSDGYQNIAVVGDFNDTPDSDPLAPLLVGTDLKDISTYGSFDTGGFDGKGTFNLGNDDDKIDYILLSPSLYARISACGIFRKGAWPGVRPKRWPVYPELKKKVHAASDHHPLWVEID